MDINVVTSPNYGVNKIKEGVKEVVKQTANNIIGVSTTAGGVAAASYAKDHDIGKAARAGVTAGAVSVGISMADSWHKIGDRILGGSN